MKKKAGFLSTVGALTLMVLSVAGCATSTGNTPTEPPAEVVAIKDKVTKLASHYAARLGGSFGDKHAELVQSGQGSDSPLYGELKAVLDRIREESGAYYVYCLIDQNPTDEFFEITVDGSVEPDDWFNQYEVESQFLSTMAGTPTPAPSAWNKDEHSPVWSSFAPVRDSQGRIVAILGVDYPAPQILKFPEWNRDSDVFISR